MGILIKMNDLYYDASEESYDTENLVYNSIGDSNSDILALLSTSKLIIDNLQKTVVYSDSFNDVTPVMKSNTAPSPYVVTASSSYNNSYLPWKAFNGTNTNSIDSWMTANGTITGWLMIDLAIATDVNCFKITSRNYFDSNKTSPKNFTLEGSHDGTSFETIKTFNEPVWISNQTKEYNLDKDVSFRYYRISVSSNNGANYTAIGNIKFIFKNITERFKPIDKFDSFQIINTNDDVVIANVLKSKKELIVSNNAFEMKYDVVNQLNYFKLDSFGNVRIVFSIDCGQTWLSYIDNKIITLSCNIPLKVYSSLTSEELLLWNNCTEEIIEKGMTSDELSAVDFDAITFTSIRFAYVLVRDHYNEITEVSTLSLNFDAKGHLRKMKKSEYDTLLYDYGLHIKSLIDTPLIKLNALLKESNNNNNSVDKRIKLATPTLSIVSNENNVTVNWNSVEMANYYKVYVNGVCLEDSLVSPSTFEIEKNEGKYIFCVRAYSNDTTKYKPSDFSNMEHIDFARYLANTNDIDGGYNYVAIKLGDNLFKLKVKK